MTLDAFTRAYIEAALWSSTDDNDQPLDRDHGVSDIAESTLAQMIADCKDFQESQSEALGKWYAECGETPERAGHDFWLTRNGHGAGYWDRWNGGTPQGEIGKQLTDTAHVYGSCDLYIGDDALIYG